MSVCESLYIHIMYVLTYLIVFFKRFVHMDSLIVIINIWFQNNLADKYTRTILLFLITENSSETDSCVTLKMYR